MACIPEMLKMKGNKPDFKLNSGIVLEGGGTYKGFHYCVTFTSMGHRCGYVAIPANHKFAKFEDYYDLPVDVHGGVTFYDQHGFDHLFEGKPKCHDKWIGFDAAHAFDTPDIELACKLFPERKAYYEKYPPLHFDHSESVHRTYNYMEFECKRLIDQIVAQSGNIAGGEACLMKAS